MNKTDWIYLAGIIDGEGCVSLRTRKVRNITYVTPCIQITNTDYRLMEWLKAELGATLYKRKDKRPNRKDNWLWVAHGQIAKRIIGMVRPYLRLKTEQADIILNLTRITEIRRDSLGRLTKTLTIEQHTYNALLVRRIHILNQRGLPSF